MVTMSRQRGAVAVPNKVELTLSRRHKHADELQRVLNCIVVILLASVAPQ